MPPQIIREYGKEIFDCRDTIRKDVKRDDACSSDRLYLQAIPATEYAYQCAWEAISPTTRTIFDGKRDFHPIFHWL